MLAREIPQRIPQLSRGPKGDATPRFRNMSFADLLEHAIETTQPPTKRGSSAASVASSRLTANLDVSEQLDRLKKKHDDLRRQAQATKEELVQTQYVRENLAAQLSKEKAGHKQARMDVAKYRSLSESSLAQERKLLHETAVLRTQYAQDKRFAVGCLRAQNRVLDSIQDEAIEIRAKLRPQSAAAAPAAGRGTRPAQGGEKARPQTAGPRPVDKKPGQSPGQSPGQTVESRPQDGSDEE